MKPVMQTITDPKRGDCLRAVIASLLDLDITQVPHFLLFGEEWHAMYRKFLCACGFEWEGTGHFPKYTPHSEHLKDCHVDGYLDATVPSKTYPVEMNIFHAVVMDRDG